jgi:hypothetical protein
MTLADNQQTFVSGWITQNSKLRTQNSVYGPENEDKILVSPAING